MPVSSKVTTAVVNDQPEVYEAKYVHEVYDRIAAHFSSTRYKPWPVIAQFLSDLPTGWVGLDSGTGNGKYLPLPADRPGSVWTIGMDRSRNLLEAARKAGDTGVLREVVWADVLGRGWRKGGFDYAISIATIHHLATSERRRLAVKRLIESVSPAHGRVLIYVWAVEQDELSKRAIPTDDTSGSPNDRSAGHDVFVPWVLAEEKPNTRPKEKSKKREGPKAPTQPGEVAAEPGVIRPEPKIFNRYYHMFAEGELRGLVCEAAREMGLEVGQRPVQTGQQETDERNQGIEIVQDGWERSNYYVEFRRWKSCNTNEK